MFRNVMVPVDGSSFSREAVLQGVRLASLFGATLRLVRVASTPPFSAGPDAFAFDASSGLDTQAAELSDLYAIAAECRAHSTINVTASLERGPVIDALCGYARRNAVDLIIMRSHARGGIARAWFGSVADALIRESGVPVLVVRPPSVATGMEKGISYRRIIVPLDGSVLAEQSLPPAILLAKSEAASILLLLVVAPVADHADADLLSSIGPVTEREVFEAQTYLDSIISRHGSGVRMLTRIVVSPDIPSAILRATEAEEADLVTLATRGRGMMARTLGGSVSDRVMRESVVSTLIIHPTSSINQALEQTRHNRSDARVPASR